MDSISVLYCCARDCCLVPSQRVRHAGRVHPSPMLLSQQAVCAMVWNVAACCSDPQWSAALAAARSAESPRSSLNFCYMHCRGSCLRVPYVSSLFMDFYAVAPHATDLRCCSYCESSWYHDRELLPQLRCRAMPGLSLGCTADVIPSALFQQFKELQATKTDFGVLP